MVRRSVDGRNPVGTRRETASDDSRKNAVLRLVIETLEERELGRIERRRGLRELSFSMTMCE